MLDLSVDFPSYCTHVVVGLLISPFRAALNHHSLSLFPRFAEMNEQTCRHHGRLFQLNVVIEEGIEKAGAERVI